MGDERPRITLGLSDLMLREALRLLRSGAPTAEVDDFIRAIFRRQEPTVSLPAELQAYIAQWRGMKPTIGRPRPTPEQKTLAAANMVESVERLTSEFRRDGANAPRQSAFEALALTQRRSADVVNREYRAALKELRAWPDFRIWRAQLIDRVEK
jgi:hypothetical protein